MTDFDSCSSGRIAVNFLRRTKGEFSRSTKVCTLVMLALMGQGGTAMIEVLLLQDPIVLRLRETDSRLDTLEAVDEIRIISDMEPRDGVVVVVAEFRIVSEAEDPEKSTELEKLSIESRVPGEAEKKDDRDELDMLLKRVVWSRAGCTRVCRW